MTITHCTACGKKLELMWPDTDPSTEYYDNALVVEFSGGDGMFVDRISKDEYRAIICHGCAHDLCSRIPWIDKLIDPHNSHAHRAWKRDAEGQIHTVDWPGHQGWDLPHD